MKTTRTTTAAIMIIVFIFFGTETIHAQNEIPEWITKLPSKIGYVYGAGIGKSTDLSMATKKARLIALTDLTNYYTDKFESFAIKCDTILGADNEIRQIVTSIKINQEATLIGVVEAEKAVDIQDDLTIVYLLLKLNVSADIKMLKNEVGGNSGLRKKMDKKGLLKELDKL